MDKQKVETVSHRLMEVCVESGLTITEMFELACMFPQVVKDEIYKMEQRVKFNLCLDQGSEG